MRHGISDQEWMAYLDGTLGAAGAERLEAHLTGCLGCWDGLAEIAQADDRLRENAAALRHRLTPPDALLHAALRDFYGRLQREAGPGELVTQHAVRERLQQIEAVLSQMCGPRTAASALRAAAQESPAKSLELVTSDNWTPFLANLTSIATVMCGETGAHLVWESGQIK